MLRVRNLGVGYGPLTVLRRVSLHVREGEVVTLIGPNGAGKTTLLRTVAGLAPARAGEVLFRGQDLGRAGPERTVALGCSLVPEGRQVFAAMPVRENLLLGGTVQYRRGRGQEVREDLERVHRLFPVLRERERQLAGTLSGGEQQMLAIGRALMARPRLLMLDEPSMGLAPLVVKEILAVVERINAEGTTVLLVEQNARSALRVAHRGYVLETGRIALEGSAEELLANRDVQRAYLGSEAPDPTGAGRAG
ncbi:MAG TPA: ABC transporter ATP-binding protein [Anaeromyxobacteraceae bacterium]|nr:ABC transporter ATP-binding protein [Anaeromyxobacteraceae bacterium]